ncbi:hypothetical protein GOV09_04180 [Candidatus Woesearchaeota archaeon]|nr:hypothetical protein [Candidatus Woesearchaeota archaeon]
MKAKKIFTSFRVIFLIIALILAIVSINPNPMRRGVAIGNVVQNSSAAQAGILSPNPTAPPMTREVIESIDNTPIRDIKDYFNKVEALEQNSTINIVTNRAVYNLRLEEELGLSVQNAPQSNIRKGLDLQGGTRVLLQPEEKLSQEDIDILIANMKQRLNVYGLSDLIIRQSDDLPPPFGTGNQYIVVEIAGATKEEVSELLAKQGKFEAKIANKTAFTGGDDIRYVCRTPDCAGIDPQRGCSDAEGGSVCTFRFSITLSQEAAERQADITRTLNIITEENGRTYLDQQLIMVLDDAEVDQLNIGSELKGSAVTEISISGSGVGINRQDAIQVALDNMKRLQTILITGSLPVKINIIKTDTTSPLLGEAFINNAIFIGVLAMLAVALVIFIRYRKLKISLTMVVTMVSEVILLLGTAALIGWNIDLAAIAGILIAVGTGVDDQIVITDETLKGESERIYDWKKRLKRAFFIIMGAYFTTVVAMLPLVFAGAGLLKGFAITTIIGVSIGVFITRPTYAKIIEILTND